MEISETEKKRKKRKPKILMALKKNSMEFCVHTSLHGLQYLGEPNRPIVERIEMFEKARLVCRNFINFGIDLNLLFQSGYEPDNGTTVEGMTEFLEEFAPSLNEVINLCRWRGESKNCSSLFKPVITDDGLCYTSNIMSADELFTPGTIQREWNTLKFPKSMYWTFEPHYSDKNSDNVYPARALTSGIGGGLLLLVSLVKADVDPLCSASVHGVKVVFNNPADYPAVVQDQYFRIPVDRDVVVDQTSHHDYNCLIIHLHSIPGTEDIPVCNIRKLNCTETTSVQFTADESGMMECGCLPSCTEIKYDVEISQAIFNMLDTFQALNKLSKAKGINKIDEPQELFSMVSVFFKDHQFVTQYRSELYGIADFLASCGGVLGLCLGFSFLSLVEIIYFFTISNSRASKNTSY